MAVTIWTAAKAPQILVLSDGATVSVAVVTSGSTTTLKWKREKKDGTWPADSAAVQITTLSKVEAFPLLQLRDGAVLIGNGVNVFWKTKTLDPQGSADFEAVTVL